MLRATFFYHSKIFMTNELTSPFGKDDFYLEEAGQSLEIVKHFKIVVKHFKTIIKHFEVSTL